MGDIAFWPIATRQAVTVPANGTLDFTATVSTAELAPGNYLVGIADADEPVVGF